MVLAKSRLVAMAPRYGSRTQKLHDIQVCHYIIQPLVELYGDCMVVLKVS